MVVLWKALPKLKCKPRLGVLAVVPHQERERLRCCWRGAWLVGGFRKAQEGGSEAAALSLLDVVVC